MTERGRSGRHPCCLGGLCASPHVGCGVQKVQSGKASDCSSGVQSQPLAFCLRTRLCCLGGLQALAPVGCVVQEVQQLAAEAPVLGYQAVDLARVVRHVHPQHLAREQVFKLLLHHLRSRSLCKPCALWLLDWWVSLTFTTSCFAALKFITRQHGAPQLSDANAGLRDSFMWEASAAT